VKNSNNIKFYYFLNILRQFSDENNILTMQDINNHLKNKIGATLDRRTIYSYIADLKKVGLDISSFEENKKGYYLRTPSLEDYEIRLLIDSVSSSKCITKKKTKDLIDKLLSLNSVYVGYSMHNQVFIDNRSKSGNEEIFYNIYKIEQAIAENKKISFNYYDFNTKRELMVKCDHDGNVKKYIANPITMILKEEYYYLVLNIDKYDDLANYRIDRIKNVNILEDERKNLKDIEECKNGFDAAIYAKKSFKM
jgi:predicted DNA-binding transcriptional regulator YafY